VYLIFVVKSLVSGDMEIIKDPGAALGIEAAPPLQDGYSEKPA
jgi:hypothetical protein